MKTVLCLIGLLLLLAGICTFFAGARAKLFPVPRLFSVLVDKPPLDLKLVDVSKVQVFHPPAKNDNFAALEEPVIVNKDQAIGALVEVPLGELAWGRSGDKANMTIIARKPECLPWIAAKLTADYVGDRFAHVMTSSDRDCYFMPVLSALNFLLHSVLRGGIARLRNNSQAKAYAQVLLDTPIAMPQPILEA